MKKKAISKRTGERVLIDTWWNVNGIHFFMNKEDVVKF